MSARQFRERTTHLEELHLEKVRAFVEPLDDSGILKRINYGTPTLESLKIISRGPLEVGKVLRHRVETDSITDSILASAIRSFDA